MAITMKLWAEKRHILRYIQAGVVNTGFGYGVFALLVTLGLNLYAAQIFAHIAGMAFNYFTFSRYAFANHTASPLRFVVSYAVNYGLSVCFLWLASRFILSPYVAGLIATIMVAALNYLILRRFVFKAVV